MTSFEAGGISEHLGVQDTGYLGFVKRQEALDKWKRESWTWEGTHSPGNTYFLELRFSQPKSNRHQRSGEPFKTVYKETLSMTFMPFIGNIGGTLGMFIGFSLIDSADWLLRLVEKALSRLS